MGSADEAPIVEEREASDWRESLLWQSDADEFSVYI